MNNKTINIDIEVIYSWFDFDNQVLHRTGDYNKIFNAIENGDYDTFIQYYKKYNYNYNNQNEDIRFFPDTAPIFYNGEWIGDMDITCRTGFNMITDNKCWVN